MRKLYRSIRYRINYHITNNSWYKEIERKRIGNIIKVDTLAPVIALTFDGGPDPNWTPRVLAVLEKYRVAATFFVIGEYAERHREIVAETASKGHVIGNHSWDHPSFPLLSRDEIHWQVRKCSEVIAEYEAQLFRPPYGHLNKNCLTEIYRLKKRVITWDVHPFDWQDRSPKWMVTNMIETIRPGSIVLLHDAVCVQRRNTRVHMLEALDSFLSEYGDLFRFTTIPELLKTGTPLKEIWNRKPRKDFFETHVHSSE